MKIKPLEHTGVYRVTNENGECLVLPVPGFPQPGVKPEWAHSDFGFGFSKSYARDQVALLYWDYRQKAKVTKPLKTPAAIYKAMGNHDPQGTKE